MRILNLSLSLLFSTIIIHQALAQCEITGTTPGDACAGQTGIISATATQGSVVRWYDQMTGGTLLGTGANLNIPNVSTSGTYYAEAYNAGVLVRDTLNTLAANNGQVSAMFDCKPLTNITVTGFNFSPRTSGTATYTAKIYYKSGTLVGSEANSSAWTLLGTSSSFSATYNVLTRIPLTFSQQLNANQIYAFYIHVTSGTLGYTNGSTLGAVATSNSDIEIYQGRGGGGLFTSSLFTVRTFSGTMIYEKGGSCTSAREPVLLNVIDNTNITKQTIVDSTCTGFPADFYVESEGNINNYKWQILDNNTSTFIDIIGNPFVINGDTLNITAASDTLNGATIRCVAMGQCGDDTSANMKVVVSPPPSFINAPQDLTLAHGQTATFTVTAAGVNLKYQWQVGYNDTFVNINDGGIYNGAKTNKLVVTGVSRVQNEFQFRCVIKGSGSCATESDTSDFGMLFVSPPASVNNINGTDEIAIYPNPIAGSELNIRVSETLAAKDLHYAIYDKLGRIAATGNIENTTKAVISLPDLSADVYTIVIREHNGSNILTTRFTKL